MKLTRIFLGLLSFFVVASIPGSAFAGDAVTIVFNSGQVVRIDDGYRQIVDALRSIDKTADEHRIVELNIGGGSFMIDVADVVIACRDRCENLTVLYPAGQRQNSR